MNKFTQHDNFFAKSLSQKEVAKDFFKAYLPEAFRDQIDFDSLQLEKSNTKFVKDCIGKHTIADVLFKASFQKQPMLLLVHIEHLSSPNKMMPLRAVNYAASALLDYAEIHPKERLPPIVTLVYYHGKQRPYPYSMEVESLFEGLSDTQKSLILKPILIDLFVYNDKHLYTHGAMTTVDILQKYIFDKPTHHTLKKMLKSLLHSNPQMRSFGIQYIMNRYDSPEYDFIETVSKHLDKEDIMTVAEQMEQRIRKKVEQEAIERGLQEGIQKGIEKGIRQGMKQGVRQGMEQGVRQGMEQGIQKERQIIAKNLLMNGLDLNLIAKTTGLDLVDINQLKKQLTI